MLVSSSAPNKKRKRTSGPDGKLVKSKKIAKSCDIPELILCADQLKSDVKEEVYEPIIQYEEKYESTPVIKQEKTDVSHEKEKSAKKKSKKKKKKSSLNDFEPPKQEIDPMNSHIASDGVAKSEIEASDIESKDLVKEEPLTPEKPSFTIEPTNIGPLFMSNIKQELEEIDDAVVEHVSKKLSYKSSDSCIDKYQTTLHCAIPPQFNTNIQNGIKAQLATLHLKYLESEQGVLLKCSRIRLKEKTASIVSISPELHFDVSCLVTIFKPKRGAILEGTIVKLGPGFVNCLVYGYFTAVVYDRFSAPVEVGNSIKFKLQFYQVTVHNDFILKGIPVT